MIFNSIQFIWTLPAIFLIYYLVVLNFSAKKSLRFGNVLLVIISYCLYLQWDIKYVFILFGITLTTYLFALLFESKFEHGRRHKLLVCGVLVSVLPLLLFKYLGFISETVNDIMGGGNGMKSIW